MPTVLLLGRTPFASDDIREIEDVISDLDVLTGATMDDVVTAFEDHHIDAVFVGAGLELESRLEFVSHVFEVSKATTVHLKDMASGRLGMMAFVKGILVGLQSSQES